MSKLTDLNKIISLNAELDDVNFKLKELRDTRVLRVCTNGTELVSTLRSKKLYNSIKALSLTHLKALRQSILTELIDLGVEP